MFYVGGGAALTNEELFLLQNHAIQILSLCPADKLPTVLYQFDEKVSESGEADTSVASRVLTLADYLVRVLSIQFWRNETTIGHKGIEFYPLLVRYIGFR